MAKLNLGTYVMELTLLDIMSFGYDYMLSLTCGGIQVFAPWMKGDDTFPEGHLFIPADDAFDETFRDLLHEEWPVRWMDREGGQWCVVLGYPSAFHNALEMRDPFGYNEESWWRLGDAAKDRDHDRMDRLGRPKRFHLQRDPGDPRVRLSITFDSAAFDVDGGKGREPLCYGDLCFNAIVTYEALERFLDALKSERESKQDEMKST
ncbi:MAG: hypothetical protein KIT10_05425 [Flavobacteriales bacterium]|nr:hypothetical protein [Flavobacteriales bacterium]